MIGSVIHEASWKFRTRAVSTWWVDFYCAVSSRIGRAVVGRKLNPGGMAVWEPRGVSYCEQRMRLQDCAMLVWCARTMPGETWTQYRVLATIKE